MGVVLGLLLGGCTYEFVEGPTEDADDGADATEADDTGERDGTGESGDIDEAGDESCGDGVKDEAEMCDGEDLDELDCVGLGFASGELACAADCSFDVASCTPAAACGDGVAAGGEECDGDDFNGRTCESFGLEKGALSCTQRCTIDTSMCG